MKRNTIIIIFRLHSILAVKICKQKKSEDNFVACFFHLIVFNVITLNMYHIVCLASSVAKAPTSAALCSITQYYRGPWFKSRDRQLDSGFLLSGSVNRYQV